jgi:hypothetical protein
MGFFPNAYRKENTKEVTINILFGNIFGVFEWQGII